MDKAYYQHWVDRGYHRIPLVLETLADLDTPLSLYLKLANTPYSYLLESVVGGERFARYSYIGLSCPIRLETIGNQTRVLNRDQLIETHTGDPLDFIAAYQARWKVAPLPFESRFCGGLSGYFSYDVARWIEPRLQKAAPKADAMDIPDILLLLTEKLAVVDTIAGKLYIIVYADATQPNGFEDAQTELENLRQKLNQPVTPPIPPSATDHPVAIERPFAQADYLKAVERAKEYIMAGDLMQVQVGQQIHRPFTHHPITLYRALRSINPSPYMYYYDFGSFHVVGASPEILVREEKRDSQSTIIIRPLAGTRPRGATPEEDLRLEQELLADPKERAEHVMLIDLARNDIGRIAETGSVKVTDQMTVERYSHVMHIVSNVEGTLKPNKSALDVIRATFPAGTLTGAPKVRAMELIDELEPTKRGFYGGACGYLSFQGDMDLAISIRTGIIKHNTLYVQASAGIVADSIPMSEWQETENKVRGVLRAAEWVDHGLTPHLPTTPSAKKHS
jgi:anthranilate synthase component I